MFFEAIRTHTVTEPHFRARLHIGLDLLPVVLVATHLVTVGTNRQQPFERLDFVEGFL